MRKLVVLLALVLGVATSHASMLYWFVENEGYDSDDATYTTMGTSLQGGDVEIVWDQAFLYANNMGTLTKIEYDASEIYDEGGELVSVFSGTPDSSSSFRVELLLNDEIVGEMSGNVAYNDIKDYLVTDLTSMSMPSSAYEFSGFTNVPEPTSGLLMLLGLAALGLKRGKNRV